MSKELPGLADAIRTRYAPLAGCCGSLSCGDALGFASPGPGEVLVDLGCGKGRDVLKAAGLVGSAGQAIGLDATEEMLAAARASVPPFLANVRFVKSDLGCLDLPDALADVVISNCTINHAPDKAAVYREIRRVLKPGGRFVASDVIAERELPLEVRGDPAAWAACYGGAIPEPEYLEAARSAGLDGLEVLARSEPYEKGGVMVHSLTLRGYRGSPPATGGRP